MNRIQELEQKLSQVKEKYFKEKSIRVMRIIEKEENLIEARLDELRRRNAEIKQVIEKLPFSDIAKFQLLTALGLEEMQT